MKLIAIICAAALAGCAGIGEEPVSQGEFNPSYQGVETRKLDGDLVSFKVKMSGARQRVDVLAYAECAAAQYTLIRGFGFLRQVRTNAAEQGGIWTADAIYTISPALPRGNRTIDAEVTVAECGRTGIPTV